MPHTVAILGGGVAGLSAAHELVERGFQVSVFERKDIFGGKARSLSVPHTGTGGRPSSRRTRFPLLPRILPASPDTMNRIPFGDRTVAGNLIEWTRILVARAGMPSLELLARLPQQPADWALALHDLFRESAFRRTKFSFSSTASCC